MTSTFEERPDLKSTREGALPFRRLHDPTFIPTAACIGIGALIALFALMVSGPVGPDDLTRMVAYP
jgi:hypothetical protein